MRLIDADALILAIRDYADKKCAHGEVELANGILKTLSCISNAPTIEPVKRGEWANTPTGLEVKRCSVCNEKFRIKDTHIAKFCPNCGTDMRTEDEHA